MLQHADELSLLQTQIVYKKRMEAVMQELTVQETALQKKADELRQIMLHEQKDVKRLEGRSLASFFYFLTGQMDSIMDKERREAYAARVKYDAAVRELEAVREDIFETAEDLRDLQDCEGRYARLLEEKRLSMEHIQDKNGMLLLEKGQHLHYLSQQEQEIEEAISAGTCALRTMADIQQNLHSAKDWSNFDNRTPAFWVDHARREKVDEAQEHVEALQVQLQRFNKELSDITIRPNLRPSIDRMLSFADSFFDNLTKDMTVPERIFQACTLADQTREHILGVLRQLQNALEEVRHVHCRTQQERDEIVLRELSEESLP